MSKPMWKRAFLLGQRYERGLDITTAVIRRVCRVSKATAKRDMVMLRKLVPVLSSKPAVAQKHHTPQRTIGRRERYYA